MRLLALTVLTLALSAADASAANPCGGGGNGRQGGPLVRLIHPFQSLRPAARGCQPATAFPRAAALARAAVPVRVSSCPGGVCPAR